MPDFALEPLRDYIKTAQTSIEAVAGNPLRSAGRDDKPLVVFVNGLGTSSHRPPLRAIALAMQDLQFGIHEFTYAPDGTRPWGPRDTVRSASVADYVSALDYQIRDIGERPVVLVGHSQGGLIVSKWLLDRPPGTRVRGAAFVACPWSAERELALDLPWGPERDSEGRLWPEIVRAANHHGHQLLSSLSLADKVVEWDQPTYVLLCEGQTDGLLPSRSYGGVWTNSNVVLELWNPPPNVAIGHTQICWQARGNLEHWLQRLGLP